MGEAGDEPTTPTAGFTGMQEGLEAESPPEQGTTKGCRKFHLTALALHLSKFCAKKGEKERREGEEMMP